MSATEGDPYGNTVTSRDELDAEAILEEVLHRKRYPVSTKADLAKALAKVRADQPLRRSRGGRRKYSH